MTANHDISRIVRSWIREDEHESADHVLQAVLAQLDATPQRRSWWPAWRFQNMNNPVRLAIAAAAILVVALVGYQLLPSRSGSVGGQPTPSVGGQPTPGPTISPAPTVALTRQVFDPFRAGAEICGPAGRDPACVEDPRANSITFTVEAPARWARWEDNGVWIDANQPPGGAAVFFYRGGWLFSKPCETGEQEPDIRVGPTVDDLVTALVDHPSLDVTAPTDATLAGYSGRYLDLTVPDDISSCSTYRPLESHIYAQGPGHRWHMWILDVNGVRVLVEANDYAGTSAQRLAEQRAILDSLVITP